MKFKILLTSINGYATTNYYLIITEEQKRLLDWLDDNDLFGDISYEVVDEEETIDLTK